MSQKAYTPDTSITHGILAINWLPGESPLGYDADTDYYFNGTTLTSIFTTAGVAAAASDTLYGQTAKSVTVPSGFESLGLTGTPVMLMWRALPVAADWVQVAGIGRSGSASFDGESWSEGGGGLTVIQGSSIDGAVSGTPIGPDLNLTHGSLFQYALTIEDYAGPSISGSTFSLRVLDQDNRQAGTGTSTEIGTVGSAMDGTSLVLTISVPAADIVDLETSPPNESVHYVYTCVLTNGSTVYAAVMGGCTVVRAAV